jgi:hypothetical protein
MAETPASPLGGKGPSEVAFLANPTSPSYSKTLGKRPHRDETEEADFDITNP